jgi:uncharacterized protein (TIGR03663 family)
MVLTKDSVKIPAWFGTVFVALVALAMFVRLVHTDLRPLHSDEGVNYYFLNAIDDLGYYKYSHENYHGPSFFYLASFFRQLCGTSEQALRAAGVLPSLLTILLLLLFLSASTWRFILIAASLMAVSSSMVFYARYAIHESLFVFGGTLFAFSAYLWWQSRGIKYIYMAALALGLLVATKETFIISLFAVGLAMLGLGGYRQVLRDLREQRKHIVAAALLMIVLVVCCFSGAFQWAGGLREMFLAVPQWIGRNESDTGHFKPFFYYLNIEVGPFAHVWNSIIPWEGLHLKHWVNERACGAEPHLVFMIVIPLLFALCHPKLAWRSFWSHEYSLGRYLFFWTMASCGAYAFVSYKTPWLVTNMSVPATLCLSWIIAKLVEDYRPFWWGIVICAVIVVSAAYSGYMYNFQVPYGHDNPYSYVHTRKGMLRMVDDIHDYLSINPEARILVGVNQYWPLPFYLRSEAKQMAYLNDAKPEQYKREYSVLIVDKSQKWKEPGWELNYYRLSDVQEAHVYYKRKR